MNFDATQLLAYTPMLILIGMGCVILLAETFVKGQSRAGLAWMGVAACVAALVAIVVQWPDAAEPVSHFDGMLVVDRMALYLDGAFIVASLLTLLFAPPYLREQGFEFGEFYALVLFAAGGMVMVAHATNMVSLLIGIETMSLAAYVLTGCWRKSLRSSEGAMKYFLMGAFATGFLVYGIALVYGTTGGAMSYADIATKVNGATKAPLFFLGEYFILVALAFKVAAVPFHMWAPDAYEGAPTPVTGFMAAGVKAAAFGAIVRLLGTAFASPVLVFDVTGWANVLALGALITMTVGNLAAVRQENVKRMLAYSSIGHAGYLLIGVVASGLGVASAKPAVLFYLITYTFTTLGAFGVVAWIGNRKDERLFVDDWKGIAAERPGVALAMTIFLLSLGGVPPTGGFFGKFYLFKAAMESPQLYWLVVIAVLNSVVSVYYYLRIVVAMYFYDPMRPLAPTDGATMRAGLLLTALAVVLLGVFPSTFVDWAGPLARAAATCLLAACAGCVADQGCPPFAHIVGGDFGRTGDAIWWTLQVEQLSPLTFNQSAVPANFLEYRWAIDIDSDRNGAVDLRAAIEHFAVINAAPVTTADILSQTSDDLLQVMGGVASNVGSFTASIDTTTNTFRFDTTAAAAAGLANVTDRAQSTWKTVYRSGADVEDQCDDQWP